MARKSPRHLIKIGEVWYYRRTVPRSLREKVGAREFKERLGENRREAERLRDVRDYEIDRALKHPEGWVSFRDFALRRWIPEHARIRRDVKGAALAETRLELHVFPLLGRMPLEAIRREQIRALAAHLLDPERKRKISVQTAKHILADVRCVLRYAHLDCELTDRVPSFRDLLPKMDEVVPNPIPVEDLAKLRAVATEGEVLVLDLAAWTGMRMGEIDRAHRMHVSLKGPRPKIQVPKSKSHKAREVPLMPYIAGRIQESIDQNDSVLISPLRYDALSRLFRSLCRRAGVTAHFHQLRHNFGCFWLAAGGGLLELQEAFGHSDLRLTQRYARLMSVHVGDTAARIAAVFGEQFSEVVQNDVQSEEIQAVSASKGRR